MSGDVSGRVAPIAYNIREAALERGAKVGVGDIDWTGFFGAETRQAIVSALKQDLYIDAEERRAIWRSADESERNAADALVKNLQADPPSRHRANYLRSLLQRPNCWFGLSLFMVCVSPWDKLKMWQELYQLEQSRQWPSPKSLTAENTPVSTSP